MNKKGFVWLPILLVILAVAIIGGGVSAYMMSKNSAPAVAIYQPATTVPTTPSTPSTPAAKTFSASPISGPAPLTVTFSNFPSTAAEEDLHFGDGKEASNGLNGWPSDGKIVHTYTEPGTYTANLVGGMSNGALGQFTITVTGASNQPSTSSGMSQNDASFSASPVSGLAPLQVGFTDTVGGTRIDFGDGQSSTLAGYCSSGICSINHLYKISGTYTAQILEGTALYCTDATPCKTLVSTTVSVK